LDELLTATPPVIELETVPRPKGEPGTPTKFYKLAAKSAKSANREQRRGLSQEIESGEGGEVCELSMSAGIDMPTLVRTIRTVREAPNHSIPGVVVDTSQSSHSSQGPDTEFFE
jgi:hypothetical protein